MNYKIDKSELLFLKLIIYYYMKTFKDLTVSIVIATYNGEKYIEQQLVSFLSELSLDDEVIIIDDASLDNTLGIIKSIASPIVKVIVNDKNCGVIKSFERGLLLASNEIIFLCDQDDIWLPGKRAAFIRVFDSDSEVSVVISDAEVIDENGIVIMKSFMNNKNGFHGNLWNTLVKNRYLGCAMAIKRNLLKAVLPIPNRVPMHDQWIGLMGTIFGKVYYISTPLLQYRRHSGNFSPLISQGILKMVRDRLNLIISIMGRLYHLEFKLLFSKIK